MVVANRSHDLVREAHEWARKTTRAQGLPLHVVDPAILQAVAVLMSPAFVAATATLNRPKARARIRVRSAAAGSRDGTTRSRRGPAHVRDRLGRDCCRASRQSHPGRDGKRMACTSVISPEATFRPALGRVLGPSPATRRRPGDTGRTGTPDVPRAPWSPDETDRAEGGVQLLPAVAGA